jgi:hypothetical protein
MCLYARQLTASDVEDPSVLDEVARQALFAGKLVLVGIDHETSTDKIESPAQGTIAGVHSHAMALDNLISFDRAYIKPAPKILPRLDGGQLVQLALLGGVLAIGSMLGHYAELAGARPASLRCGKGMTDLLDAAQAQAILGAFMAMRAGVRSTGQDSVWSPASSIPTGSWRSCGYRSAGPDPMRHWP